MYVHMYVHMCTYTTHTPVAPCDVACLQHRQAKAQGATGCHRVLPSHLSLCCPHGDGCGQRQARQVSSTPFLPHCTHNLWAGSGDVGLAHLLLQGVGVVRVHRGVEDLLAADVANASDVCALLTPLAARCQLLLAHQAFLRCPQPWRKFSKVSSLVN